MKGPSPLKLDLYKLDEIPEHNRKKKKPPMTS